MQPLPLRVAAAALLLLAACRSKPVLENAGLRLEVNPDASVSLLDKKSGANWDLGPPLITLKGDQQMLARPSEISRSGSAIRFTSTEGTRFELSLRDEPPAVEYSFEPVQEFQELMLLNQALALEPGGDSYYAVPHRIGILLPAQSDKPYRRRFPAYQTGSGYSMAMLGAVKDGSALLASWDDPYTDIVADYSTTPTRRLTMQLALRKSARSVRLQPLGKGGYVEIAKAYRAVARQRGFLKTLTEKVKENPKVEKFFGAADFKPFAYMPLAPNTRWNASDKEVVQLNFTFEECADLAEHYAKNLGIDRAMLVLNGWINRGYDNRHPDILPAAPPIGGNEGLIACSRRVRSLGWLFGLHDNYQDMYKDAPSWNEAYLMKLEDGSPRQGGVWAGGQCWLICSRKSLELAARPQNVPGAFRLFEPDLYFSDTLFAAPLYECHDPGHPLTWNDDLTHKRKLCDYMRGVVGLFGSEEGREWGVAHADYFEGLMSHRTRWRRPEDRDIIIPMFELVFADAIPLYTHQSDRPKPDMPEYILDHILYAEMPVYYFGNHRYWQDPAQAYKPPPGSQARLIFAGGGRFGLIDQFIKNTYEVLSPLHRLTALMEMTGHEFLTPDRTVEKTLFGADVEIVVNYGPADFETGDAVLPQYGFLVKSPSLVAYCVRRYGGVAYSEPTMMVLRSLDGAPLETAGKVRIYRAFGGRQAPLRGKIEEVETERIVGEG
jgi:hypothetical protein